jgi:hypothetical protein
MMLVVQVNCRSLRKIDWFSDCYLAGIRKKAPWQEFWGCSPINAVRELGSERREIVRSISGAARQGSGVSLWSNLVKEEYIKSTMRLFSHRRSSCSEAAGAPVCRLLLNLTSCVPLVESLFYRIWFKEPLRIHSNVICIPFCLGTERQNIP